MRKRRCIWDVLLRTDERVRSRLIYCSHGSSDLAQEQPLGFQSNPVTISLAPTGLLANAHLKQQTLPAHRRTNNGGFVDMKISHALTRSWGQLHNISLFWEEKNGVFLSSEWTADQKKKKLKVPRSNAIFESDLICASPHIHHEKFQVTKTFYCIWNPGFITKTALTLTHISTTISVHWGNWQRRWAEGLWSFASGKEFGFSSTSRIS